MPDLLKIADSLYRLRIPGDRAHLLNCYLWQEPDGVTLIDTGWPGEAGLIAEALAMLGLRRLHVKRVVLTHFHEDHTGAAAEIADWADVEVIAGAADAPFIRGDEPGPLPVLTDAERTLRSDLTEPPVGPPCRVDTTVRDGDVLDFAGGARVVGAPGHTPGSIGLYLPAADAVLTGDAVAEFNGHVIVGRSTSTVLRPSHRFSVWPKRARRSQVSGTARCCSPTLPRASPTRPTRSPELRFAETAFQQKSASRRLLECHFGRDQRRSDQTRRGAARRSERKRSTSGS